MQRRSVLKILCVAQFLTAGVGRAAVSTVEGKTPHRPNGPHALFTVFVDTLIPADDESPAASELGVAKKMLDTINRSASLKALYSEGLKWLDRTAHQMHTKNFIDLEEPQRVDIISLAEKADHASVQRKFFREMRDWAMELYYSHPDTWSSFGQLHPPQPVGYFNYSSAPEKT